MRSIGDGSYTLAARQLLSKGVHEVITEALEEKLRDLHPDEGLPRLQHPPQGSWPEISLLSKPLGDTVRIQAITEALAAFKVSSAPGVSGLRPQHLQELTLPGNPHVSELLMQVDLFVEACLKSKLAISMGHLMGAATLIAIKKSKIQDLTLE